MKRGIEKGIAEFARDWAWLLVTGSLSAAVGALAILWPVSASIGLLAALATVLFISGGLGLGMALRHRRLPGNTGRFMQSIAAVLAGVLMVRYPGMGMVGIGITLGSFMFVGAVAKGIFAMDLYPRQGWGWMVLSAVSSLALGVLTLILLPGSAFVVPGLLLGIDLIFYGVSLAGLAMRLRAVRRAPEQIEPAPRLPRAA